MKFSPLKRNVTLLKAFALYLGLSVLLLLLPASWTGPVRHVVLYPLTAVHGGLVRVLDAIGGTGRSLGGMWRADKEVVQLRSRVSELEAKLATERDRRTVAEARLELLGHLPETARASAVLATVTGYDPAPLRRTATFDKGSRHGVVRNGIILRRDVLVGRVVSVGPWSCRAVLLGDPDCRVAVRCARSRVHGILEGMGGDLCRVKYVSAGADVRPGDTFLTSGVDGIFPAGRLVGACTEASGKSGAIFRWVAVKPTYDATRLETVVILAPEIRPGEEQ